jgi:hypothetical protein
MKIGRAILPLEGGKMITLALPTLLVLAGILLVFLFISGVPLKIKGIVFVPKLKRISRILSGIVGLVLLVTGVLLFIYIPQGYVLIPNTSDEGGKLVPPSIPIIKAKYSFENDTMGWKAQDASGNRACVQVLWSDKKAHDGKYALEAIMDLVGGDTQKSKGEVWIDLSEKGSIDLTNRTISAWVYADPPASGATSDPNGFQLFVKDNQWRGEYGTWKNVAEGTWVQLLLTVSSTQPKDGFVSPGFEPSHIIAIGVKMGAGGNSTTTFHSPIYVDEIDW